MSELIYNSRPPKEQHLFPFLEEQGITSPPKVMWGKHDETRVLEVSQDVEPFRRLEGEPRILSYSK